jgi:hypothetical protein
MHPLLAGLVAVAPVLIVWLCQGIAHEVRWFKEDKRYYRQPRNK